MTEQLSVKKWALFKNILILLMHTMTLIVMISSIFLGFTQDNGLYMATEFLDLFALIALLIIVEAIKNDEKSMGSMSRETMCLLVLSFTVSIGLFGDFFAWIVQGIPQYRVINYLANFMYYIAGPWSIYRAWRSMRRLRTLFEIQA